MGLCECNKKYEVSVKDPKSSGMFSVSTLMYHEADATEKSHQQLSSSVVSALHVTFLELISTCQGKAVGGDLGFCEGLYSK